ncbi:PAS domain-containing methyl-accepting chemotaxis protein [Noviherbaspirillum denitrificans]|uniref:Chemotaxis protein n=1 Tax=Noviherbaspirillum denitrificans TaxID=1968433 RepID=A0A254T904_9BURK|nr:PAS domain-containing methyl-accepting chemotaxis protein [Noviherbaspirillum denitrificans]OWW19114.1 chemotaxis protein [Noviherbaspirillum denitrificans]
MRTNLPVTGVEYILKDTETIVSKTDLKGRITYVNQDFINISGFTEAELLGAPQNIVRHPDMPSEAFEDFWRTIQSGKAWTGLVKNRSKNGDHYWVEAHAAPLIENGQVTGYTSIRIKPTREQVAAAENAYRMIKSGDKSLEVREGSAVRRTVFSRLRFMKSLSLKTKMMTGFGGIACLFGAGIAFPGTIVAAAGLLFAALFGFSLYRDIVTRLERAKVDIDRMSAGDLSCKIQSDGDDEISRVLQAVRVLQTNVKLLVGQIKEVTDLVNKGSNEIAAGNSDLSARTESQASSLEETASSMEELTSTVRQNADNAHEANQLVIATSSIAVKGGEAVGKVVETMASIRESSSRISDIISVIDGIAFQTNILALNAAVEAARAGEQGRGFAVVASEVRTLAQRSASAAKEIKDLINDSVQKVESGTTLVDDAGKTMAEIVSSVRHVTDIMNEITSASREQSAGIEQVNMAITQMDEITQQNAALVEQSAAAAETLREQAAKQAQLVSTFKLISGMAPGLSVVPGAVLRPHGVKGQQRVRAIANAR